MLFRSTREEIKELIDGIIKLFYDQLNYQAHNNSYNHVGKQSTNNVDRHSYNQQNNYPVNKIIKRTFKQAINQAINHIDYDKDYLITYTSEGMGKQKGVVHSAYNLFLSGITFGESLGYGKDNVLGHCMPMTYMAGILNSIFVPYIMGSKIVLLKRLCEQTAMEFCNQVCLYRINTFWLSPAMLHLLLNMDKNGQMKQYFDKNKPVISVDTAPLEVELKNQFENRYGVKVYQSYCLPETLFISSENIHSEGKKLSSGTILSYVKLRFLSDGEILVNTPWMLKRYTNQDMKEYVTIYEDEVYYKTGNLGELKEDCLYLMGRKKNLF